MTSLHALLGLACAALCMLPVVLGEAGGAAPSAPKPTSPTYTNLASFNGQIAIKVFKKASELDNWAEHICKANTTGAPCNQPLLTGGSNAQVKIVYNLKNMSATLRTWKNATPAEVVIRLDYHGASQIDRGWRKKNQAWPGHGWHAKWTLARLPWSTSGEAIWNLEEADEVTDALLYPEVCVICQFADGSKDYCQCDRCNAGPDILTIETAVTGSITPAMRGAAIALSIFSPVFLIVYAVGDNMYYKRTGRSLRFAS